MEEPRNPTALPPGLKAFIVSNYDRVIVTMLAIPLTVYLILDYASLSAQTGMKASGHLNLRLDEAYSKLFPMIGVAGLGPGTMDMPVRAANVYKRLW